MFFSKFEYVLVLDVSGLCGSPRIADVGGVPNLIPLVDKDKIAVSFHARQIRFSIIMILNEKIQAIDHVTI